MFLFYFLSENNPIFDSYFLTCLPEKLNIVPVKTFLLCTIIIQNVSLLLEEAALNGTDRVAFDGLATEEQCLTLMNLVQVKYCLHLK